MSDSQPSDGQLFILPLDAELLDERLSEMHRRTMLAADLVQEAIDQSAETTHDNAPFDSARADKDILGKQADELRGIKKDAIVHIPDQSPTVIDMGTVALLFSGDEYKKVEIAGDWHARHEDTERLVLNRRAPFAALFLGKLVNQSLTFDDKEWQIVEIQPSENRERYHPAPEKHEAEDWKENRIVFMCGPHASGKSAVAFEVFKEGYAIFDTGPTIRALHKAQDPDISFPEWVAKNEAQYGKKFTNDVLGSFISEQLASDEHPHPNGIVIIGNRSFEGIEHFKEMLSATDIKVVYVNAPKRMLLERYNDRGDRGNVTEAEFAKILEVDLAMGLQRVALLSDHRLLNDGTLEAAVKQLNGIIEGWKPA